jgi:hypothetical protein
MTPELGNPIKPGSCEDGLRRGFLKPIPVDSRPRDLAIGRGPRPGLQVVASRVCGRYLLTYDLNRLTRHRLESGDPAWRRSRRRCLGNRYKPAEMGSTRSESIQRKCTFAVIP